MLVALAALLAPLAGCDDTAHDGRRRGTGTRRTSTRRRPSSRSGGQTTLFPAPVAAGGTSETERTVPGSDFAYALLAPGWSPDSGGVPPRYLVAVRSADPLSVATHDRLRVVVSPDTFVGDCATGPPLDDDDARLIVERIFPEGLRGRRLYDPATCVTTRSVDGGTDGDPDGD